MALGRLPMSLMKAMTVKGTGVTSGKPASGGVAHVQTSAWPRATVAGTAC